MDGNIPSYVLRYNIGFQAQEAIAAGAGTLPDTWQAGLFAALGGDLANAGTLGLFFYGACFGCQSTR